MGGCSRREPTGLSLTEEFDTRDLRGGRSVIGVGTAR